MPSLLAVLPVTIRPALRRGTSYDQVEPVAVSLLSGLRFAFDVERLEFSNHVFLR